METILNPTNPQPAPLPPRVRARLEAVRSLIDGLEDAARAAVDLIDGILLEDCGADRLRDALRVERAFGTLQGAARTALEAAERELADLAPAQCPTERRRD